MASRSEKALQDECIAYLKSLDDCWYVKIVGSATQTGGIPDLLICYKGKFIGVELKKGGAYQETGRQKIQLKRINRAGGVGVKVETLEALKAILESPS